MQVIGAAWLYQWRGMAFKAWYLRFDKRGRCLPGSVLPRQNFCKNRIRTYVRARVVARPPRLPLFIDLCGVWFSWRVHVEAGRLFTLYVFNVTNKLILPGCDNQDVACWLNDCSTGETVMCSWLGFKGWSRLKREQAAVCWCLHLLALLHFICLSVCPLWLWGMSTSSPGVGP